MYLQREIERKNRLLACQLFLKDSKTTTCTSEEKPGCSGIFILLLISLVLTILDASA